MDRRRRRRHTIESRVHGSGEADSATRRCSKRYREILGSRRSERLG